MIRSLQHLQATILLTFLVNAMVFGQDLQLLPEKDTLYVCPNEAHNVFIPVQGGSTPYSYNWSTGETSDSISVFLMPSEQLALGLTVLDANGDSANASLIVVALEECVYPGDANGDRIANNYDLLAMGRAFGDRGGIRPDAHTNFIGQSAPSWDSISSGGVNHVHSDADGNGIVDLADVEVIRQNYMPSTSSIDSLVGTPDGTPFYLEMPTEPVEFGDTIHIPIMLGTTEIPAKDIYGIAFTIAFDTNLVRDNGVIVNYDNSWIGRKNIDIATIDYYNQDKGQVEIGITKIDQLRTSGAGRVADITVMIEDIAGRLSGSLELIFEIKDLQLINRNGDLIATNATSSNSGVVLANTPNIWPVNLVVENPASEYINIWSKDLVKIEEIKLSDANGRIVYDNQNVFTNQMAIATRSLSKGLYFLSVKYKEQNNYSRFATKRIVIRN